MHTVHIWIAPPGRVWRAQHARRCIQGNGSAAPVKQVYEYLLTGCLSCLNIFQPDGAGSTEGRKDNESAMLNCYLFIKQGLIPRAPSGGRGGCAIKVFLILAIAQFALTDTGCARRINYHQNGGSRVRTGLENFAGHRARKYAGKTAILVSNQSGFDFNLEQNITLLRKGGIRIDTLLAPEHGVYGNMNELDHRGSWYDPEIKCRVYNLYRLDRQSLRRLIERADVAIFDIQDMGMRCYTYISNLKDIMDAMDGLDRELIVLDRPNPAGFLGVDGAFLEKRFATPYVSAFPAPFLYGMTIGEAARYYRKEYRPGVKLQVVSMRGYRRGMLFRAMNLPWIPPSPNLPTCESAIVYTFAVYLEGTNLSLGRGTTKPFEYIGAPWIDPAVLSAKLTGLGLENFMFKPVYFTPASGKYAGARCGGVQIFYTGDTFSPTETAYRIIGAIMKAYPYQAQWVRFGPYYDIDALAGTDRFRVFIREGRPWKEFEKVMAPGLKEYRKKRRKALLCY
jgi:uncharacterized protein YbbC (DUF1343 family)